jgi:DNA ligase-associated metallophosphoesterase
MLSDEKEVFSEFLEIELRGERLFLLPDRAFWWPSRQRLIVADVHLGKATHFNRHGSVLPIQSAIKDLRKLKLLSEGLEIRSLLVLGDLFHSTYNNEFEWLQALRDSVQGLQLEVVRGNHDIVHPKHFSEAGILLHTDVLEDGPFLFVHDPTQVSADGLYPIGGHVHPGVALYGRARQREKLSCFYIGVEYALLPAFGSLTGLHAVRHSVAGDRIIAIVGDKLVEVPSPFKTEASSGR